MRAMKKVLILAGLLGAAACGNGKDIPPPDKVDDLAWMDTLNFGQNGVASAVETGLVAEEPAAVTAKPAATRSTAARSTSTRRTTTARSSSSGTYSAPAPVGRTVVKRNTARDAAIGAAGGAVIGAVAGGSRHRVKGAIIGGAAGAVLGGVIGHTVDKKTTVVYE
jgi:outer membrane lipoprotein SlyB